MDPAVTDEPVQLEVSLRTCADGVHEIAVHGEIDYLTAPQLVEVLDAVPAAEGGVIALDLACVPFCDSAGLSALVRTLHRVTLAGGELRLVAIDPRLRRTLDLTGLTELFGAPG